MVVALEHLEIMQVWKENQNMQKYVLNKYLFLKLLVGALFLQKVLEHCPSQNEAFALFFVSLHC